MRNMRIIPIIAVLLIAASAFLVQSCGKMPDQMPNNQVSPKENPKPSISKKDGKTLKSGSGNSGGYSTASDTTESWSNVATIFWVHDSTTNEPLNGVIFDFGDGSDPETGSQVPHKYANSGIYLVTANCGGGVILQKYIVVQAWNMAPVNDNITILLLSGSYNPSTNMNTVQLALLLEKISTWQQSGGYYFTADSATNWTKHYLPSSDILMIDGHKYIKWTITVPTGWTNMGYGRQPGPSPAYAVWAYDPTCPYWKPSPTNPDQGTFMVFVQNGEIFYNQPAPPALPGVYGDQGNDWLIRGENFYFNDAGGAAVKILIRKSAITNPNGPYIRYKIGTSGSSTDGIMNEATDHFWFTIPWIEYDSLVFFDIFPGGNGAKVNLTNSMFYNSQFATGMFLVVGGEKKSLTGEGIEPKYLPGFQTRKE